MSKLFTPFDLTGITLRNRIVMAPMTRARAPHDIADERTALYYAQRATAGLIVSEGTPISRQGQGYLFNPGIFSAEQIEGWKLVTNSVRAVGGRMFAQIWHVGRVSHVSIQKDGAVPVSSTAKRAIGAFAYGYRDDGTAGMVEASAPRALETDEVVGVIEDYAQAAENAIAAGFDGVEIHGANGYLIDQFINPLINDRTDAYCAQTLSGRLRFPLEIVDAVAGRIGRGRTAIRLSPYGQPFDMPLFESINETFQALVTALADRKIAYIHFMDHSRAGSSTRGPLDPDAMARFDQLMWGFRACSGTTALVLASNMTMERATDLIDKNIIDLAAFGRPFISNPDLVERLRQGLPLQDWTKEAFYGGGNAGYLDYAPHRA
jgi:N-ethylmaleimide reductase